MCGGQSFHFDMKVVFAPEEEFMVVGVSVWSCGDYSSESPVKRESNDEMILNESVCVRDSI